MHDQTKDHSVTGKNIRLNNFDLIRIVAALQVVFVHTVAHLHLNLGVVGRGVDHFLRYFSGVPIFFVISGFLISISLSRNSDIRVYGKNRVLRIFPALWVNFLVSLVVLAFFGYWRADFVKSLHFIAWIVGQMTIVQFYNPAFLRDFGVGVLNGSLWTIPVELQFYILLPIIFVLLNRLNELWKKNLLLVSLLLVSALIYATTTEIERRGVLWAELLHITVIPHLFRFMVGALLFFNFNHIYRWFTGKFLLWTAIFVGYSFICIQILGWAPEGNIFLLLATTLLQAGWVMAFAFSVPTLSGALLRGNDISYGVYIYHMVVVNVLVELGFRGAPILLLVVMGLTASIAWISWKLIEAPALRLKNRPLYRRSKSASVALNASVLKD